MGSRTSGRGGADLRILELCHYYPPHNGGLEKYVQSLVNLLKGRGHQVEVWSTRVPDTQADRSFRCLVAPMANPITPGLVLALREKFDIIHAHVHYCFSTTMAALLKPLTRSPLVITCHGTMLAYDQPWKTVERLFNATLGQVVLKSADTVVVSSQKQRAAVYRLGNTHQLRPDGTWIASAFPIEVIPPWPDTDDLLPNDPGLFRRKHGHGLVLLCVGRLLPVKGLPYLLKALEDVDLPLTLWIAGEEAPGHSGYKQYLQGLVELYRLTDRVEFLGHVPRSQLADVYLASDLFLSPTLGEGSGLSLLEAMSFARCCVASDVSTCNEILGHLETGYLVPPQSPDVLKAAILYLASHPSDRWRMGSAAYEQVQKYHTGSHAVDRYIQLFEEVRR